MVSPITTTTEYAHIVCTPGVMGGEPRIDGHRIRVRDVAAARDTHGFTAAEIAAEVFPQLTLAEIYAALAYFEDHRKEMRRFEEAETVAVETFEREHPERVGGNLRSDALDDR